MKLTIIGSGTAVPQRDRSSPCYLVRRGRACVVVDLGPGAVRGLLVHGGVTAREAGAVLISHFHPDHCNDLAALLFALRSEDMDGRTALTIAGPEGLEDHCRALRMLWGHRVDPLNCDLNLMEWSGEAFSCNSFRLQAAPTQHSLPNLAWHIRGPRGPGVILTGDGEPTRDLIEMGRSGDHVLVAECSLEPGRLQEGHMNPGQAGNLARSCRSRMLVLSHLNPGVPSVPARTEAEKHFGGEVVVAHDGMGIEIKGSTFRVQSRRERN